MNDRPGKEDPLAPMALAGSGENGRRVGRTLTLLVCALFACHVGLRLWYASDRLHDRRFYDEKYNVDNVRALLESGRLAPANGFYPTLAYLPQALAIATLDGVAELTGDDRLRAFHGRRMSAAAFLVARSLVTLLAVASLILTYQLGRRLFSSAVGALAAAMLAGVPWHVHASAYWKPDSLVMLTLLAAVFASVCLVERPTIRRFVWAGVAVGLAMSSKFTAASGPLVVITAALLARGKSRSTAISLVAAGVAALAVFVLLNPQIGLFFRDFGWTVDFYDARAREEGSDRLAVVGGVLLFLREGLASGPVQSMAALIGIGSLGWLALGAEFGRKRRREWLVLLAFPLCFIVVYALGTARHKTNNLLPLLPVVSLLAAVAICFAWRSAQRAMPRLERPLAIIAVAAPLLVLPSLRSFLYAYRSLVPTTLDVALTDLPSRSGSDRWDVASRTVYYEGIPEPVPEWERRSWFGTPLSALAATESLIEIGERRLDSSDGEIFLESGLTGEGSEFYRRRMAGAALKSEVFRPGWFRVRGPPLVALWHPWEVISVESLHIVPSGGADGPGSNAVARLPDTVAAGEWISFVARTHLGRPPESDLEVGRVVLPLQRASRPGRYGHFLYVTDRLQVESSSLEVFRSATADRLLAGAAGAGIVQLDLWRWRARAVAPGSH